MTLIRLALFKNKSKQISKLELYFPRDCVYKEKRLYYLLLINLLSWSLLSATYLEMQSYTDVKSKRYKNI